MKYKRPYVILVAIAAILSIPLIAMQFTDEVNWEIGDFAVMAALLFSTGLAVEITTRKVSNPKYKLLISLVILIILMLIWVELSVGIFGTQFAGN